jgi:hypothetical protein
MVSLHDASGSRRFGLAAIALLGGLAAAVLWRFPPEVYDFYPMCPVYEYLHLRCPGCGATRAVAALLHGRLAEAMRWNALTVAMLAAGIVYLVYGAVCSRRAMRGREFRWPVVPRAAVFAGIVIAVGFGVIRNL